MIAMLIVPLSLIVLGIGFYFGYKYLSKINFNLNGIESILFQLSFIGIFFGMYNENYNIFFSNDILIIMGVISIILLVYYYILRMIKLKLYIKWQMYIVYILLLIIDAYSLSYIPMYGWDALGYGILFLLFAGLFLIFLLLINFITFLIRKKKNIKLKNTNEFNIKKDLVISVIILSLFLPLLYGMNFSTKIKYEMSKIEEQAKEKSLEYLNKKYGDGDFKIIESVLNDYDEDYTFKVSSKYITKEFNLYVENLEYDRFDDDFLFIYYSEKYNDDIYNYYDIKEYVEEYIYESIKEKYEIEIDSYLYFDEERLNSTYFGKIPSIEDLINYVELDIEEITINKVFTQEEIEDFCKYIINIYETLNYKEDILWFKFNYDNPYSNSIHYKNSGYLRNAGDYWYYVYVDATPINVKKDLGVE